MQSPRFIISGGGTGGHIFPAIAIADALKRAEPGCEILFVGAKGRMEMERVPAAGYRIEGLWISGFQRNLSMKNLSFPLKLISSLVVARGIVRKFKPNVAVGVGGYASGPLLQVASGKNIPSLIQEQNSFPGVTNRLLAKKVDRVCVSYNGMERWFPSGKIVMTGNPVREMVINTTGKKPEAATYFGLKDSLPTVLVIGGSLGARTINESIAAALSEFIKQGIQLIWQTGKSYAEQAAALVANLDSETLHTTTFIDRMDLAYAIADVVVSRAGAMSVSEICLIGKPAILVPSPNVAEDHQTKNAQALVENNAALLVTDASAREKLMPAVLELVASAEKRETLGRNAAAMAQRNSAEKIAGEVLKLVGKN